MHSPSAERLHPAAVHPYPYRHLPTRSRVHRGLQSAGESDARRAGCIAGSGLLARLVSRLAGQAEQPLRIVWRGRSGRAGGGRKEKQEENGVIARGERGDSKTREWAEQAPKRPRRVDTVDFVRNIHKQLIKF